MKSNQFKVLLIFLSSIPILTFSTADFKRKTYIFSEDG